MDEVWKDIDGGKGVYQVSNFCNVRSLDHYSKGCYKTTQFIKGQILKQHLFKKTGYLYVTLHIDGKHKKCLVHRLVAEAFIPNPNNYPTVDHINRIRTDNRIENLRWLPHKLQTKNSSVVKSVEQYTLDGQFVAEYYSAAEAERQTGIKSCNITLACQGKQKTAGGYIWKYSLQPLCS